MVVVFLWLRIGGLWVGFCFRFGLCFAVFTCAKVLVVFTSVHEVSLKGLVVLVEKYIQPSVVGSAEKGKSLQTQKEGKNVILKNF